MRSDVGWFRLAFTWTPEQFAVAIAGIPIPRDLVRDIVGIEIAEYPGDEEGTSIARGVEIAEHALADRRHVIPSLLNSRQW